MLLEKIFKHTLVLSLKHRFDRQAQMKNELKKIDISWDFFDAVNGYEKTTNIVSNLLPGEKGIKESHIQMLQKAIDNNWDSIFIFEDDVEFCPNIKIILQEFTKNIPENCDLLYLGGHHRGVLTPVQDNVYQTKSTFTTHAMWISKSIFNKAIDIIKNTDKPLDDCYSILQQSILAYVVYPNIVWQRNDYSDIQNKFNDYSWLKNKNLNYYENYDKQPVIHGYFTCYNEAYILPHALKHYSLICDKIFLYDNQSTDNSVEIAKTFSKVEIIEWNTNNQHDVDAHLNLGNNVWKNSIGKCDYVIVADIDEFLYHSDLKNFIKSAKKKGITLMKAKGFWMIGDESLELKPEDDLITSVPKGIYNACNDKVLIFDPNAIKEINYVPGFHQCSPIGDINMNQYELRLLHFRMIGLKNYLYKQNLRRGRQSEINIKKQYNTHYWRTNQEDINEYRDMVLNRKPID